MAEYIEGKPVEGTGQSVPVVDGQGSFGYLPESELAKLLQGGGRVATADDLHAQLTKEQETAEAAQFDNLGAFERYAMPQVAGTLRGFTAGMSDSAAIVAAHALGERGREMQERLRLYQGQAPVRSASSELGGAILGAELMPGSSYLSQGFRVGTPAATVASGLARGAAGVAESPLSRAAELGPRVLEGEFVEGASQAPRGLLRGAVQDAEILSETPARELAASAEADAQAGRELVRAGRTAAEDAMSLRPTVGEMRAVEYGTKAAELDSIASEIAQKASAPAERGKALEGLMGTFSKVPTSTLERLAYNTGVAGMQNTGSEISNEVLYNVPLNKEAIIAAAITGSVLGAGAGLLGEAIGATKLLRSEATADLEASKLLSRSGLDKAAIQEGIKAYGSPGKFASALESSGVKLAEESGAKLSQQLSSIAKDQERRVNDILRVVQKEGSVNTERLEGALRSFLQENASHPERASVEFQLFGRDGKGGIFGAASKKGGLKPLSNARVVAGDLQQGVNQILQKEAVASTFESASRVAPGLGEELAALRKAGESVNFLRGIASMGSKSAIGMAAGKAAIKGATYLFLPPGAGHVVRFLTPYLSGASGVLKAMQVVRDSIGKGIEGLMSRSGTHSAAAASMVLKNFTTRNKYEKLAQTIRDPKAFNALVSSVPSSVTTDVSSHMATMQQNALAMLPPGPQGLAMAPRPQFLNTKEFEFLDYLGVMLNPHKALRNAATLSDVGLQSLGQNYPELMNLLRMQLQEKVVLMKPAQQVGITAQSRKRMSKILGTPIDYINSPDFLTQVQNLYAQQNGGAQGGNNQPQGQPPQGPAPAPAPDNNAPAYQTPTDSAEAP